jgi:hypothetical protein
MASARTLGRLHNLTPTPSALMPGVLDRQAYSGQFPPQYNGFTGSGPPYDATGTGRRLANWNPTPYGQKTRSA